jgi:hypothetical protein
MHRRLKMQTLVQNFGVVNYLVPATRSNDSSIDTASAQDAWVSLKGYSKVTWTIQCGAMTEATTQIKVYQAKSVSGTSYSSTALAMTHYWTNVASAAATGLMVRTAATGSQVVLTSVSNAMIVIETDAKQLDANNSYDCVALVFTGISGATCFGVTAHLHHPRYASDPMIVDANV